MDTQIKADIVVVSQPEHVFGGRICSTQGCARPAKARGMCTKHYHVFYMSDEFTYVRGVSNARTHCSANECTKTLYAKGLCHSHYEMLRRSGSLEGGWFTSRRRRQARKMKADGSSYSEIGEALGITRQRAQQIVAPTPGERKRFLSIHHSCHFCGSSEGDPTGRELAAAHVVYRTGQIRVVALCVSCHIKFDGLLRHAQGILE
jgi:hypothetical protein